MFAKAQIQPGKKRYIFNISKYYKIWFSPNPDIFLGIENQLRFVRMRHNNPKANLFFIYSETCLSPEAIIELNHFCKQYSITPVALEEIESLLVEDMDKALYALAQQEIIHAQSHAGGNMAAASDIVRMIIPVIQKYGIYSDFDVETRLEELNSPYMQLRGPLLFNAEYIELNSTQMMLATNTDFLAFSLDNPKYNILSKDALIAVQNVQSVIINNYKSPLTWEKISLNMAMKKCIAYPQIPELFEAFDKKHPKNPSIFDFRMYLSNLPDELKKTGKMPSIKEFLTKSSVINISGPGICSAFFKPLIPGNYIHMPHRVPYKNKEWLPYLTTYEQCSIGFYDPIYDRIMTKNRVSSSLTAQKNETLGDNSWTKQGMIDLINRETQILDASVALQRSCRRHILWKEHPEESLFFQIKTICSKESSTSPRIDKNYASLLSALIDKDYALVLRRACSELKLSVVEVLLKYKKNRGIDFNLNAPSISTGATALNLALECKLSNQVKKQALVKLLRAEGAMTADEMSTANSVITSSSLSI